MKEKSSAAKTVNHYEFSSPIGCIAIEDNNLAVTAIRFLKDKKVQDSAASPLAKRAHEQLSEYFAGERKEFDLPIAPQGTEFQKKIYAELLKIPYGEVCTYKDIAVRIGNPKACRAVGGANNKNDIPILIPCHRVIGANGNLVGYSDGLDTKEYLLNLEKLNK